MVNNIVKMSENSFSSKRIAKNTIFLYIRMVVTMLISLYTSRKLLQVLGVEDFGIYGLVGGIVTMFASLKTMFTVATQRFLNIELGRGNHRELNKVFNVSLTINSLIAVLFVVIVEIGGLWLLQNKLNIPANRWDAAFWVFQLSVFASLISIINIPFDADIIAREKMNVYAIVSIFDAFARLGVVVSLPLFIGDKLIIYGLLILLISVADLVVNIIYCRIKFPESSLHRYSRSDVKLKFVEMFSFSGWAFFGNMVFALVNEGINILLNIFSGVTANAARTITYQVKGALSNVVSNVYVAVKPQAIQSYARHELDRFYKLMFTGAKVVGYMYLLMAIPLYFTLSSVLMMWLGTVPDYAIAFISASLLYQFVRVLHESIGTFFVTIGQLKEYQITEFFALGSALPIAYIGLKYFSMPLFCVFLVMTFSELLNLFAILILAKKIGQFDISRYFKTVLLPYSLMALVCFISVWIVKLLLIPIITNEYIRAAVFILVAIIVELVILFFLGFNPEERKFVLKIIKREK